MMPANLKPLLVCPCGGDAEVKQTVKGGRVHYYVQCPDCKREGQSSPRSERAVYKWRYGTPMGDL